ncbi:MAG: tetratricopeptide repeat protein [Candidatus Eisenbacteria bacterium]
MRSVLCGLLVVVVLGALTLSGCAKNPHLAGGILYLSQKNFDKAMKELETAVQQEPTNGLAHLKLAMAYAELDETKKAGAEFDKALELDPKLKKDVDANRKHYWVEHFNEGVRLSQEDKNFPDAAKEFEMAIDVDPSDPRAYSNLGFALTQTGEHERALAVFEKAATVQPTDEASKKNLAAIYEDIGKKSLKEERFDDAIKFFDRALQLQPEKTSCMFELALCYFQKASRETVAANAQPEFGKAISYFKEVLKRDSTDVDAVFNMGSAYLAMDDVDEATVHLKKAVNMYPKIRDFHRVLGRAYARAGEQELAVTELVLAKALDPNRGRRMSADNIDAWVSAESVKARGGDVTDVSSVIQNLGKPEELYSYEEAGSLVEVWFYWTKGTALYLVNGKIPPENKVFFNPQTQ